MRYIFIFMLFLTTSPLARAEDTLIARYDLTKERAEHCLVYGAEHCPAPVIGGCPSGDKEGECCIFGTLQQPDGEIGVMVKRKSCHLFLAGTNQSWIYAPHFSSWRPLSMARTIEVYQDYILIESIFDDNEKEIVYYTPLNRQPKDMSIVESFAVVLGVGVVAALYFTPVGNYPIAMRFVRDLTNVFALYLGAGLVVVGLPCLAYAYYFRRPAHGVPLPLPVVGNAPVHRPLAGGAMP